MKVLFLSDTLLDSDAVTGEEKLHSKQLFLDYLKFFRDFKTKSFFEKINIKQSIPNDRYIVFYDTFDFTTSFDKLLSGNGITKKFIQDLQDKKCSIIFFHTDMNGLGEYRYDNSVWKKFSKTIKKYNIENQNISFIFHETVVDEQKNFIDLDFKIIFHNRQSVLLYPDNKEALKWIFSNSEGYYRQFKYCSHNNNIKDHRVDLFLFLIGNNFLDDGICSFFGGYEPIHQGVDKLNFYNYKCRQSEGIIDYTELYNKETVDIANKLIPMSYDLKVDGLQDYLNIIPHFNSYFNIVTESVHREYDGIGLHPNLISVPQKIHITEKVWKCIVSFQPFILISNKNNLKKLKEWGFKTFEPWIDESYDEVETYEERRKLIYSEIKRLNNMTIEELDKWYWEMEEILVYNYNHFFDFVNNEYFKLQKLFINSWNILK
jgi:hypothetical protein